MLLLVLTNAYRQCLNIDNSLMKLISTSAIPFWSFMDVSMHPVTGNQSKVMFIAKLFEWESAEGDSDLGL